ncbi:NAD-dependent epimerase/dehydratase family protein [Pedobacter sp.]|uniref:NAD-dependent epimerase/dehydratase family protein n=1 Tax=Pedobacter sp. TaxID=1411316 RepID=UPI003BA9AE1C
MKKRVLITGATGFVGYHLIKTALDHGLEVFANVRSSSAVEHLKPFDIKFVDLDFNSIYLLKRDIEEKKYHYIVHAAGTTKAPTLQQYNEINATYTRNLAVASSLSVHKIEKFVFVSSLAALGPLTNENGVLTDQSAANPVTNYGISKSLAETYLSEIAELPLIVVRPTAVYGPREKDIFILLKTIRSGLELYIGNEAQQLSFVYVSDLAELIIKSLNSNITNKSYNVSDGQIYDRFALALYARKALNKKTFSFNVPVPLIKGLAWCMDSAYGLFKKTPALNLDKVKELTARNWACSIDNLCKDFDYQPRYNLEKGMLETIKWYKDNNWL